MSTGPPATGGPLTVVLDDDPTGTQCAHDVDVALDLDDEPLSDAVRRAGQALYVLTNTRSMPPEQARDLVERLVGTLNRSAADNGRRIMLVLRGDSTLRGHVATEMYAAGLERSVGLVVPAYPAAGRVTLGAIHLLRQDGRQLEIADTEYARDPVFGYRHSDLRLWAGEVGLRGAVVHVGLAALRERGPDVVAAALRDAPTGGVVIPDVETDQDLARIAAGALAADEQGVRVVVRSGPPLAAALAGTAPCLLDPAALRSHRRVLVVCGSHTEGATRQLRDLPVPAVELPTDLARDHGAGALRFDELVRRLRVDLDDRGLAVLATERSRRTEHATLRDAALVMTALVAVTRTLVPHCDALVAKGGITSADLARHAVGASSARVRGQLTSGVSLWSLGRRGSQLLDYVVVPGNIGAVRTLSTVVEALGYPAA